LINSYALFLEFGSFLSIKIPFHNLLHVPINGKVSTFLFDMKDGVLLNIVQTVISKLEIWLETQI